MDVRKGASAETGTQQMHKEPRPVTAATKQGGIHQDHQELHWTGDCEANCHIYSWVAESQGLDLVEGLGGGEKHFG
jgi:hypothetical protein